MSVLMNQCSIFPTNTSSADKWEQWHKNLVKCVGKGRANDLFLQLWEKRGGTGSDANTIRLRQYLSTQGIELTASSLKLTQEFFSDVGDFLGQGFQAFGTGMQILWYGLIGVLVIGSFGLIYMMFVNPDRAARIGTAVATRGKSEMITGGRGVKGVSGGRSPKMINVKAK